MLEMIEMSKLVNFDDIHELTVVLNIIDVKCVASR